MDTSQYKILFVGPVGAGKTTAVASLSDKAVLTTDVAVSDLSALKKEMTTAALDYGVVRLGNGMRVHLYGAPGQQRFDFMWEVLRAGIHGLVLLIDNSRKSPLDDLSFYLGWHESLRRDHKVVVGVSFMDKCANPGLREYQAFLRARRLDIPVMPVDARKREQVERLVLALWS